MRKTKKSKAQQLAEIHQHNRLLSIALEIEHVAAGVSGTGTEEQLTLISSKLRALAAGSVS